jgi:hypothetical protein
MKRFGSCSSCSSCSGPCPSRFWDLCGLAVVLAAMLAGVALLAGCEAAVRVKWGVDPVAPAPTIYNVIQAPEVVEPPNPLREPV